MRRFVKLFSVMLFVGLSIGVCIFLVLYNTAFNQISSQLVTTVESQKAIMTSMAISSEEKSSNLLTDWRLETLSQIQSAYQNFNSFGETGEFIVAERDQDDIRFIFRQRHSNTTTPQSISFKSELAEPMRRALNGLSGTIIALDYKGDRVLAAYTPVEVLQVGIVAKLDLEEIRKPFISAGLIGLLIALVLYSIASLLFIRYASPIGREIRESEKLYRDLIEGQSDLVCRCKLDGTIIFANKAFLVYFGKLYNELIGVKVINFIPRKYQQDLLNELLNLSLKHRKITKEFEITTSSNKKRCTQWTFTLLRGETGNEKKVVCLILDITEKKLAEKKLHASETEQAKLGRIVENSLNEIYIFNSESLKFEMANKVAQNNIGYSMDELSKLTPVDIKPDFNNQEFKALIKPLQDGKINQIKFETRHQRKDKTIYDVDVVISYSKQKDNFVFFSIINDISEKKDSDIKLLNAFEGTISAISLATEARDPYTAGHQKRVSDIAVAIARELGLDENQIHGIQWGGLIHDIGKIGTPAEILSKPTKLTEVELKLIKAHAKAGYDILKNIVFPWPIAKIAYQHHERIDGSGYPLGLKGNEICFEARIVAVADVLEAITSHRPYRPALGIDIALKEIKDNRGKYYDEKVVDACLKLVKEKKLAL